jgi:hypothetical protein
VTRAAIFGSVARGQANEESDLDLLVEFAPGRTLLDLAALEIDLIALVGRPVDVVTYRSLDPHIRERVLNEQVVILYSPLFQRDLDLT